MLDWPTKKLHVSSLGCYFHEYSTNFSISTSDHTLDSLKPPQPCGMTLIVHYDDFSFLEVLSGASLNLSVMELPQLKQVLLVPAPPESFKCLEKVLPSACESF